MIQINLIPDIKQDFLKAQNNKRVVITLAFLVSAAFIALVFLMFSYVTVIQGVHTKNLDDDIASLLTEYQSTEDISKVLTVNGQLSVLPELHQTKPALTRLSTYLTKLIPKDISIDNINVDLDSGIMIIKGTGKNTVSIDKLINSLRNSVYYEDPGESGDSINVSTVFKNTKLDSFGASQDDRPTFEVQAEFDTKIFTFADSIILTIPKTSSDETEFTTPEELTLIEQARENRTDDLFEPIEPEVTDE